MLECAGSGRAAYVPNASGTPWLATGGMGCPKWTGVRLRDVLRAAGIKPGAAHVAGQGGDFGVVATAAPVIRSVPLAKAMEENTLDRLGMNGRPLPKIHGYPLRLVVPGWVGSASTKWLHTITRARRAVQGHLHGQQLPHAAHAVRARRENAGGRDQPEAWPVKSIDHLSGAQRRMSKPASRC